MPEVKTQTPEAWAADTHALTRKGSGGDATSSLMTLGSAAALSVDTDPTMAADADALVPSQKAVKAALASKAPLASPTFSGTPAAPTPDAADNTTRLATTAFVQGVIAGLEYTDINGLNSSGAGSLYQAAIIAALGLDVGERLGAVAAGGAAFETEPGGTPISLATLTDFLTGASPTMLVTVAVARYMGLTRTKSYAATLTLVLDGARTVDGADHNSDGLVNKVTDVTGDLDLQFSDIHVGLEGESWRVRLVSSSAGARDISVSTANGVTVELAPGVTIPQLGASVGDALEIIGSIVTPTLVRVERCIADPA